MIPLQRRMLASLLERRFGYAVKQAENGKKVIALLQQDSQAADIVILDIQMPEMDGLEALAAIRQYRTDIPVLILTSESNVANAVKAMKLGAVDFITKPLIPEHLEAALQNINKIRALTREISLLRRHHEGALFFKDLIGADGGLAQAVAYGRKAAATDIPVLIAGETGVGKELFAQAIHGESSRAGKPFIAINCGAIPENLVESTLFGHEKGAFTSAIAKSIGKFREAEGGTIFLDEIGELPPEAQVKLLRALQQKEIEPVGSSRTCPINVRVISATNRNLAIEVKEKRFREDLYFRLNVLPITIPPLRTRTKDIVLLAEYFMDRFCAAQNRSPVTLSKKLNQYLSNHSWPGNVRELENFIHRIMVFGEEDTMHSSDLENTPETVIAGPSIPLRLPDGSYKTMEMIENEAMQTMLDLQDQNITQAAHLLGIAKSTFYRKIKNNQP
jgi:DNA-binding NtrC family response regulator